MRVKVTYTAVSAETRARVGHQSITVDEAMLHDAIDDLLASQCDHYPTMPARQRPVVNVRIEYL